MADLSAPLTKALAIYEARRQVSAIMDRVRRCQDLEPILADLLDARQVPWTFELTITPAQFAKAVPLVIELQKLLKESSNHG